MARIYRFIGDQWTGKTTCALSGEGGTWYGELDAGSWDRASNGLDLENVEHYECHPPRRDLLQSLLDAGTLSEEAVGKFGSGPVRVIHELNGYHENLLGFREAFVAAILNDNIQTLVFDTETDLWNLHQDDLLERIQKETKVHRERLTQLEYEELHDKMDELVSVVRHYKKNLIFITRTKEEWVSVTDANGKSSRTTSGKRVADGWDRAPFRVDVELTFSVRNGVPRATISKAGGADLALGGKVIESPTLPIIEQVIDSARYLRNKKVALPEDITQAVVLSQVVAALEAEGDEYEKDIDALLTQAKLRGLY